MDAWMEYLDWTPDRPEDALDREAALLDACRQWGRETLFVWQPRRMSVVAGRSNREMREIDLDACRRLGIPVLRRCSGGGTVLIGPGCLNYAVVLRHRHPSPLEGIARTNREVMARLRRAASGVSGKPVGVEGHTDLALDGRKFSGNAQYRSASGILFHGTMMFGMEIGLIGQVLDIPVRAPEYRRGRSHEDFLTNLGVDVRALKAALREEWGATRRPDADREGA
jgi:lipoate-protein ligase A